MPISAHSPVCQGQREYKRGGGGGVRDLCPKAAGRMAVRVIMILIDKENDMIATIYNHIFTTLASNHQA